MKEITHKLSYRKLFLIVFITGTVVFFIGNYVFSDNYGSSFEDAIKSFLIYQMYALVMTFGNAWFFASIGKYYSWEHDLKKKIVISFLGSMLVTIILLVVLRFVTAVIIFGNEPSTFLNHSKTYFTFGIIVTFNINLLFHIFYFYKAFSEQKISESQVIAKTESARFETLKSQLDPHFLFNSLNVLTSLIGEDPGKAERFTTKLSKVYRYVLEQKDKYLIPFDDELDFARTYMELLKMRFEDAIRFEIPEKSSNPDAKIIPLSLQILLENAVKHNEISSENPLEIKIFESDDELVIENKINPKQSLGKSTRIGLQNIKDRYKLLTNRPVIIDDSGDKFTIRLPLLTKKISIMKTDDKINSERYIRARKKVEAIKEFYGSLVSYIIFIPFMYFIWHEFTPHTIHWYWFPALGWGIGLIFQGIKVFGSPFFSSDWEKRKLQEFMQEDEKELWK